MIHGRFLEVNDKFLMLFEDNSVQRFSVPLIYPLFFSLFRVLEKCLPIDDVNFLSKVLLKIGGPPPSPIAFLCFYVFFVFSEYDYLSVFKYYDSRFLFFFFQFIYNFFQFLFGFFHVLPLLYFLIS